MGVIMYTDDASKIPQFASLDLNYDANILNKGAELGTDSQYDQPASDKIRVKALAANNLKIRVL